MENLYDMKDKLDAQINEDGETLERLRLRIPRLETAEIRAAANHDLGSCHEIDRELREIPIRQGKMTTEMNSMRKGFTQDTRVSDWGKLRSLSRRYHSWTKRLTC
ncbi:hypothetical protein EAE96_003928 [Botrytis aclada]|nr:hypothetical protein EAE96_003928 [Botrytis aclada]